MVYYRVYFYEYISIKMCCFYYLLEMYWYISLLFVKNVFFMILKIKIGLDSKYINSYR